jgi:CubicO group peptidase (beta-lactamase class C family)
MRLVSVSLLLFAAACAGGPSPSAAAGSDDPARNALTARIDSIVNAPISEGKVAGATVAVVKGRDTILIKGYGKADLEWNVPMPADAILELGSVTKQFTAAAIMQLVEQGKINLDDDITKYLPKYPTQGNRIPVRRLLDHTSGIKGYTELPEFEVLMMRHLPKDSLVALFSKRPFDFKPGEQETYNNSAFFLAGLVIEKVSGMSYADYVEKHLFDKAGMKDSRYCSEKAVYQRRAHGYGSDTTGFALADYIDHTWPYAAGSLCSTVGDLIAWNQALHGGKLLGAEAYAELIAPSTLNDGTRLRYSKGLSLADHAGHRTISHGGGIPGFSTEVAWFPEDTLSIVVLFNSIGQVGPREVEEAIAEAVLGKPEAKAAKYAGDLKEFEGTYRGRGRGQDTEMKVTVDSTGQLTMTRGKGKPDALTYMSGDTFAHKELLITFDRTNGKPSRIRFDGSYGYNFLDRK